MDGVSLRFGVRLSACLFVRYASANSAKSRLPNFRLIKLSLPDIKFCRCCSWDAMNRECRLCIVLSLLPSLASPTFPVAPRFSLRKPIWKFTLALPSCVLHILRVTLELVEIRGTTWGMGFYWTSVASRRSMTVKSTRKGKATMVRGKKDVSGGGRLIGGDGGRNTAKTLSAIHRAANAILLRTATSARNNAAVTAPHPCRATANHPFPGIFRRSLRWHTTGSSSLQRYYYRESRTMYCHHSIIKFSH